MTATSGIGDVGRAAVAGGCVVADVTLAGVGDGWAVGCDFGVVADVLRLVGRRLVCAIDVVVKIRSSRAEKTIGAAKVEDFI